MQTAMTIVEKTADRRYTLGVVYEPDTLDTQKDFAKAADIEAAAWDFMARMTMLAKSATAVLSAVALGKADTRIDVTEILKAQRLDDQHSQTTEPLGTIVESYIAPCDMTVEGTAIKKGTWLLGVVWTEAMFAKIKKGERTGLSMYGRGERVSA